MSGSTTKQERARAREEARRREQEEQARKTRLRRLLIAAGAVLAVAVAVVLLAGGSDDGGGGGSPEQVDGAADVQQMLRGIPQDGKTLGDPDAPATVVEFVDPQCPYCADAARDILPAIINEEVRNGDLKLELEILTFIGPDSERLGALFAGAALQDKLWNVSELAFRNQGTENTGWATDDVLRRLGAAVPGLDVQQAIDAGNAVQGQRLIADSRALAQRANVSSTPTFLLRRGDALRRLELQELTPDALRTALRQAGVKGVAASS